MEQQGFVAGARFLLRPTPACPECAGTGIAVLGYCRRCLHEQAPAGTADGGALTPLDGGTDRPVASTPPAYRHRLPA